MLEHSCLGGMPTTSLTFTLSRSQYCERKEEFMLFSNRNGSLIRSQPGAVTIGCTVSVMFPANNSIMAVTGHLQWLLQTSSFCRFPFPLLVFHAAVLARAGIGGDAFCLYFDAKTKKVSAMLGNGGAPGALTLQVAQ